VTTETGPEFEVYLVGCVGVILNEIKQGCTQKQIALTYAMAIITNAAKVEKVEWRTINEAIEARWSKSAVERVKKMAWKRIAERRDKAICQTPERSPS
jgi:hypothetical protein